MMRERIRIDTTERDRAELQKLLEEAAKHAMTPEELFEQRVSWVYGQLMDSQPNVTREQVRAVLIKAGGYDPTAFSPEPTP